MDINDNRFIDQLESQADLIMRMYEEDELKDEKLAREWFYKGVKWGINHNKDKKFLNGLIL